MSEIKQFHFATNKKFCYYSADYPTFFVAPTVSEKRLFLAQFNRLRRRFCKWFRSQSNIEDLDVDMIFDLDFGLTVGECIFMLFKKNIITANVKKKNQKKKQQKKKL